MEFEKYAGELITVRLYVAEGNTVDPGITMITNHEAYWEYLFPTLEDLYCPTSVIQVAE